MRYLQQTTASRFPTIRSMHMLLIAATFAPAIASAQSDDEEKSALFDSIKWVQGPITSRLGSIAELRVPEGCSFTAAEGAKAFMLATENPPAGDEEGILLCQAADTAASPWFLVYSYDASGYVRDDEGAKLDAEKILASIREGTEAANEERRERGWGTLTIEGWVHPPHYDPTTHNLTWSTLARSEGPVVNHSVRLLGRSGVLHADLVIDPEQLEAEVGNFNKVIADTHFLPGHTYGEWRDGDKVAAYGLTALVAGGAGVAATKLGLFAKIWKLIAAIFVASWKLLIAAAIGLAAWLKRLLQRSSSQPADDRLNQPVDHNDRE